MANKLYPFGREAFLTGGANWDVDDFRVILLTSGYTYSAAHSFLNEVAGGAVRVATSGALVTNTSLNDGTADANDVTFTAVTQGSTITQFIIYRHTGTEATSRLIGHFDTSSAGAINLATNGGDITIQWDNGPNRIFTL
jgi:hypothetical protein